MTEPMTEMDTPLADFSVAVMTADLLPSVVALEEACGLNSRGLVRPGVPALERKIVSV